MHAFGFPPPFNMQRDWKGGGRGLSEGTTVEEVENTCISQEFFQREGDQSYRTCA